MNWTRLEIRTARRAQLVDITDRVAAIVARSGATDGVCHVFVPHTTAGVTINEGADPDVARDIEDQLARLVSGDERFRHAEGNSDSHIKAALVGPSCAAPVRGGKLSLGTWQAVFFCEWDGPRTRAVEVAVAPL
ncbi:MAG TPA: secondary thiamine-phosphate synthase enzyme YjbQ [Candidatus Sulfotelmatobacter sp.]|nr:secondary thiamine-phosphate synthase enzyme YjbQ [Candidatus Sulfotelmatobacter sp.]